jgi:hypothetical protein
MAQIEITINTKILSFVRKYVFHLFLLSVILLAVSLFLYFYTIHGKLSKNSNDWSNFGSYIGGIVGTILSGINLLILIILTFQTKEQQNHEWITSIRIKKYHDLINALKDNTNAQQYFCQNNLDDDFFLSNDSYHVLMELQRLLREEFKIETKDELSKFLKAIIKNEKNVIREFILKYKCSC